MNTTIPSTTQIARRWILIDAEGQVLGRLASRIAPLLRGKQKVLYTPYLDTGDFVIVINAEKIRVTGNKATQKQYRAYSGYPSGLTARPLQELLHRHPERVVQHAVKGMLPDGPLGRKLIKKLKVYAGARHPHAAQQPTPLELGDRHGHP